MEVEEVQRPRERVAHRSFQRFSAARATAAAAATGTEGLLTCLLRQTTPVLPAAAKPPPHWTASRQGSARFCHQGSHSRLQQMCKLAAQGQTTAINTPLGITLLAAFLECGSKRPRTTNCYHTNSAPHPYVRTCLECDSRTPLQPLLTAFQNH